jgi:hypothetical protein
MPESWIAQRLSAAMMRPPSPAPHVVLFGDTYLHVQSISRSISAMPGGL